MAKIIGATSIDTGSSSLKSVDGSYLRDGDLSLVLGENGVFFYRLYDDDGTNENIPYIVKPSENAVDKRWRMLSITELAENIKLHKDNNFQLTNIKLGEENKISIYDYSGNEVGKITNNEFIFNNNLQVSDIYVDRINDWDTGKVILSDGSRSFTSPIVSPDPVYAGHLANKDYVDSETDALSADFQSYKDYVDDNFAKWDNTEEHIPSHDYNPSTKKYVDDEVSSLKTTVYDDLSFTVSSSGGALVESDPTDIQFEDNIQASSIGENSVIVTVPDDLTVMSNYDTDDLDEGNENLYFTTDRIDDHLSSGEGIVYNTGTIGLDIDSLSTGTSASPSGDYIAFYDSYDGTHKNITPNDLIDSVDVVSVSDSGSKVVANASDINFSTNVNVTDDGDDTVTVTVPNDLTVMSNYDTDDLNEGAGNLYFTTGRVDDHLSGGEGIAYSTGTIDLDVNSLTTETSADSSNDYVAFYDSNDGTHKNITPSDLIGSVQSYASISDGGSTVVSDASDINFSDNLSVTDDGDGTVTVIGSDPGTKLPQILPNICSLDDIDTNSSRGSAFGMVETIDFGSGSDGAIWFTMQLPSVIDASSDITLDIFYNLASADDSTSVDIQTDYWVYGDGTTPDSGTPDGTNSDSISTGTGEENSRRSYSLSNIPSTALTAGYTITLKFTRLGSSDSYSGTFQMLYVFASQP